MIDIRVAFSRLAGFFVRLYGRYASWYHGRRFLLRIARVGNFLCTDFSYKARGGSYFSVNISDPMYDALFLYREDQPREAYILKKLIRPGIKVFHVGANFGS